ncbi:DNA polymerase IV [Carnobacteriaceae bacterium zg-ZUI252]|nr:DNA polymerase IV [Carnobacteriaceae bacterium zg-ZUI252]
MQIGILNFDHQKHDTTRKIIHIDMDAFYASVEMRDNPELKDKPVVIAKHPKLTHGRGIVSTCNYKAREYGIRSAMSAQKAYELCPHAHFIEGDITYYAKVSQQIRSIFKRYTDMIEPLSLDEAYLDVTVNKIGAKSAIYVAKCIQRDIYRELNLTCSAGVSYNKFLAKVASDYQKPAGLTTITPDEAQSFLKQLPIEKFYGVGRKSVEKLHEYGIFTGEDILMTDATILVKNLGKLGFLLIQRAHGIDHSVVKPTRQRKSLGRERTYFPELASEQQVQIAIRELSKSVTRQLQRVHLKGNVVTLKLRYSNFETQTRQKKLSRFIDEEQFIFQTAMELFEEYGNLEQTIRLIGVSVSGLEERVFEKVVLNFT